MFEFIKGRLAGKTPDRAVIEINGIGFSIAIPLSRMPSSA